MPDNTSRFSTTDGDTLRSDDLTTAKVNVAKIATGRSGVDGGLVTQQNPLSTESVSTAELWQLVALRFEERTRLLRARFPARRRGGAASPIVIGGGTSASAPFTPAQVTALVAWWNADFATLDGSSTFVVSIAPCAGSSAADPTFILANSDGTFASVPFLETPDINGKATWGTAADEIRYLQTPSFSTALNQPMTWFQVWYTFTNTNAVYLRLNTSGGQENSPALIADASNLLDQGDSDPATSIPYVTNTVYVSAHRYDPSTGASVAYLNSLTPAATGTTLGDTFTSLFTGTFPDGEPGSYRQRHILACDATLTTPDFNSIMTYLAADAGVTLV